MEIRIDAFTGEKFSPHRRNQRFSCSKNRISYHNRIAAEQREKRSGIDKPLLSNYRIISKLLGSQKSGTFTRDFLKGKGYVFGVFTHLMKHDGENCYAIYCFLVIQVAEDKIKFIRYE